MTTVIEREESLPAGFEHPFFLNVEWIMGSFTLQRMDGPMFGPIRSGHPALGWEGESRLQMYWDGEAQRYVLCRLCGDGEYRAIVCSEPYPLINEARINEVIAGLVLHDVRRGFDPKAYVDGKNARLDAARQAEVDDHFDNVIVDKLKFALKKDGADNYC